MSSENSPRVAVVARSFLDYRIPVFKELSQLLEGQLFVLFSREHTPEHVQSKVSAILGHRAVGFDGERVLGYRGNLTSELPNRAWRIPFQPGLGMKLKELMPDIVVGDGFFQWTWHALVYRARYRKRLVVCYERTAHTEKSAQWYRTLFRKGVLHFVDAMAVNGRLTREYVQSLGFDASLIVEGQMAADTHTFSQDASRLSATDIRNFRSEFVNSDASRIYLTVNRLIPLKGIDRLLRGWKEFKLSALTDDVLLIVGDGPERSALGSLCADLSIPDVFIVGAVDHDNLASYYAGADWFVMPSLVDNWSLVVPEAMACGLPILCSKYNGCWPELVRDGVNGWVFDSLSTEDIVRVLQLSSMVRDYDEFSYSSRRLIADHSPFHAASSILEACNMAIVN